MLSINGQFGPKVSSVPIRNSGLSGGLPSTMSCQLAREPHIEEILA